jgi:high-affinity iron transporter
MFSTGLIVFREVLEAAIVIGLVMAATKGLATRNRWVAIGVGAGLAGSVVVAVFARSIATAAEGMGQELFNASILFTAVALLGWTTVWMSRHGREIARHVNAVGARVVEGELPMYMLAGVIGLAVLREGAEVVLFVYGIAVAQGSEPALLLLGGLLGLALGAGVGLALYFGLLRFAMRHLFLVTSWMLALLAAGMAAQGAGYLSAAGMLPPIIEPLWDSSGLLSERSLPGQFLHTLIGYDERPSGLQAIAYAATLAIIGIFLQLFRRPPPAKNPIKASPAE